MVHAKVISYLCQDGCIQKIKAWGSSGEHGAPEASPPTGGCHHPSRPLRETLAGSTWSAILAL